MAEEPTYALAPTLSCLTAADLDATEESATENPLAGGNPGIAVDYGDYNVFVIFTDDSDAANSIADSVNAAGSAFGSDEDVASNNGNVVIYSNGEPTSDEDMVQIESCLTE